MSINIEMPKLSDTMTEGTVVKWLKQVGDNIEIGDVLAEIETDKATMEMEAFDDGVLTEIKVEAGEKAPIGGILAVLNGDSGRAPDEAHLHVNSDEDDKDDGKNAEKEAAADEPEKKSEVQSSQRTEDEKPAESDGEESGDRVIASPLARKVAEELGVDLANVTGSGPAGRIVRADVEGAAKPTAKPDKPAKSSEAGAAAALAASAKTKATSSQPAAAPAVQAIQPVAKEGDETIELSTMRKVIASRLLTSKVTLPHFYLHLDVDAAPLMTLRKQVNEQAEKTHGNKYSVNDFVLKAVINAAQTVPAINASFAGEHIVRYRHIGLSVAVAVEDGLVTPVIKQAEDKSLL
ncbi:MAG TPA: dihydrolipoamide acetyltransferase family protein, partial [Luteolibacter sp.]|nr:dihydrolipoamide acetyltransferase family protein [Luteolibacter sp.]